MKAARLHTILVVLSFAFYSVSATAQEKIGALDFDGGGISFHNMLARHAVPSFDDKKSENYYFQVDVSRDNEVFIFEKTGKKDQTTISLIKSIYHVVTQLKNTTRSKQSIIKPVFVARETNEEVLHINPDAISEHAFRKNWLTEKQTCLLPLRIIAYAPIRCYNHLYVNPSSL